MKDFRLIGALPVLLAIVIAVAPPQVTQRFYSMFDLKDPTSRDRVAMLREGVRMIAADPLTGVGPNMVEREYIRLPRPGGRGARQPAPAQRAAADRRRARAAGARRLALVRRERGRGPVAAAPPRAPSVPRRRGLGAVAAMLGAGMFEHNFGDSEFLMLFLILVTLPFAAERARRLRRGDRLMRGVRS